MRTWKQVYKHKPTWELRNIEEALSSPIGFLLNNAEDYDRLSAVRTILHKRKGVK